MKHLTGPQTAVAALTVTLLVILALIGADGRCTHSAVSTPRSVPVDTVFIDSPATDSTTNRPRPKSKAKAPTPPRQPSARDYLNEPVTEKMSG